LRIVIHGFVPTGPHEPQRISDCLGVGLNTSLNQRRDELPDHT